MELTGKGKQVIEQIKKRDTQKMIDEFERLCEKNVAENIDPEMLKKGVNDLIDNFSG